MSPYVSPPPATERLPVAELRAGDVIHPPARELSLWMRQTATERGLDSSCLTLTVLAVDSDYRRPLWRFIRATAPIGFGSNRNWRFAAKATTLWPVISRQGGAP